MDLAAKLQMKPDSRVLVLAKPDGIDLDFGGTTTRVDPQEAAEADTVIVFIKNAAAFEADAGPAVDAAKKDRLAWVCYPKAGKLGTDLNRDTLNARMMARGVRGVRQISIDETWSALRFRPLA
jgi:hypothetical protein